MDTIFSQNKPVHNLTPIALKLTLILSPPISPSLVSPLGLLPNILYAFVISLICTIYSTHFVLLDLMTLKILCIQIIMFFAV